MKSNLQCLECNLRSARRMLEEHLSDPNEQEHGIRQILKRMSQMPLGDSPPEMAREVQPLLKELVHNDDPFYKEKESFNQAILNRYTDIQTQLNTHSDPLQAAIAYAISGNVMDSASVYQFDLVTELEKSLHTPLAVDDSLTLLSEMKKAKSILYLCDNSGEIVLDRLFIETALNKGIIQKNQITAAVRGENILNDATLKDAETTGLSKLIRVIPNGDHAPGTVLKYCSDEFRKQFDKADLIISKGQGNFESLHPMPSKNIVFLLMAKCPLLARDSGLEPGARICWAEKLHL